MFDEGGTNGTPPPPVAANPAQQGEMEEGEASRLRALVQQMMQRMHADACARSDLEDQLGAAPTDSDPAGQIHWPGQVPQGKRRSDWIGRREGWF